MYDLRLSPEQIEFRDTVRDFVNDEVKPIALSADRLDKGDRSLPVAVLRKASQMGLRTLTLPEDLGGAGADTLTCCIVTEELAAGDADVAAVLAQTSTLARQLFAAMTPQQRERFLPAFVQDDDFHLACAQHESGDDGALGPNYHRPAAAQRRISTTAVRTGDEWTITGTKDCVANAPIAKLIAVEAQTDSRAALILVPRDAPGLSVTEQGEPRWYHGACGQVVLKNCRVPASNLITGAIDGSGTPGGSNPWFQALNLGIGRAAYEAALDYAQMRVQGGRRLIEHQAIGTKLSDIMVQLDTARTAVWRAAWRCDHPEAVADRSLPDLPLTTIAQVVTSEAVYRAAKDAAECFGAMGVMRDMPLQKYIHDARICLHSGDGNADARLRIAEVLANYRRSPSVLAAE